MVLLLFKFCFVEYLQFYGMQICYFNYSNTSFKNVSPET